MATRTFGDMLSRVGSSLTVAVVRQGRVARLSNVTCTLGRRDRPYPEAHDSTWTVALVRRGTFRYRAAATNRAHVLLPGWLLLGRPDAEFECSHEHDGGDACASIAMTPQVLFDVASVAGLSVKAILSAPPALPPAPRVAALVERARRRDDLDVDELAYVVAEAIVAHVTATPLADVAPHPSHVRRVHDSLSRIESSCERPLSLADLAGSVGFTPFHFLRVFRRVTGTTPHQYLIGARLRLAVRMLTETGHPVTRIAYDSGFQDLSNFVRTFHRVIGCSPGVYRRRGIPSTHAKHQPGRSSAASRAWNPPSPI